MSNSQEINLFENNLLSTKDKFYLFMDLLVSHQSSTRTECFFFICIFYIQYLSGFFHPKLLVFNNSQSKFDNVLYYFLKISRLKNLIDENNNSEILHIILISLFLLYDIIIILLLVFSVLSTKKNCLYCSTTSVINYIIKSLLYIIYNIIVDFCFSYFSYNNQKLYHVILCLITLLLTTLLKIFIQFFYSDTFYLSSSYYAKISSSYDIYFTLHSICFSFISQQCHNLTREFFFVYNIIISVYFFYYYSTHYIFYDKITNCLCGIFQLWYIYMSIFCFLFYFINIEEKGIVFIISSLFILVIYFNLRKYIEKIIFFKYPFCKISNKYFVLFYLKTMIEKINTIEQVDEDKSLITGIIQMHIIECPSDLCIMKHNQKIYLPLNQTWSYRDKPMIYDKIFLINFIVAIMNFYITQNYYSADMLINLSFYYLNIIGNNCMCLFYYKKVSEMKLTLQEQFSFKRLSFAIEKMFIEKLKGQNEPCFNLEDLNVSFYFKYEQLSKKFYNEISKDVNFLIKFWELFIKDNNTNNLNGNTNKGEEIDYSIIFDLTNKIRISKRNVEMIWEELFDLYNGINENFELYLNYIENINDDGVLKRELENFKRKSENSAENYQLNFYNILFGKETGIVIINGDQGKEGIIEKVNKEMENIFLYSIDELKGMNISQLMPKLFGEQHTKFIQNYFNIGEKKIIDNKDFKTYAKDKNHSILLIKKNVKLFPMLNNSVYFVALIIKEKINDIIFLNEKLLIQGISSELKKKLLQSEKNNVFNNNEIPFYVICKNFVNFYKIFIKKEQDENVNNSGDIVNNLSQNVSEEGSYEEGSFILNYNTQSGLNNNINNMSKTNGSTTLVNNSSKMFKNKKYNRNIKENIEINENIELEYEMKVPKFLCDYINSEMNKNFVFLEGSYQNIIEEADNHLLANVPAIENVILPQKETKTEVNEVTIIHNKKPNKLLENKKVITNPTIGVHILSNHSTNEVEQLNQSSQSEINVTIVNTQSNMTNTYMNHNIVNKDSHLVKNINEQYTPNINNKNQIIRSVDTFGKVMYNEQATIPGNFESGINLAKKLSQLNNQIECEEKEFNDKLNKYKILFDEQKLTELEEYIDLINKDATIEFKFNFTFDIYKFGEQDIAYIIRCINNNNKENDLNDDMSENINNTNEINLKKEILDSLKPEIELLYEESAELRNLPERFLNLLLENKSFEKMISARKEEINKNSRIHGSISQYEQIQEDENASQASSSSFNEDLCKRNRIEEIRGNTLKSVSNFYTLNYIRSLVITVLLCSIAFFVIYIINFDSKYEDMKKLSLVNMSLYESSIWFANLISSLISLRTLIEINNNETSGYEFKSYIENPEEYFSETKDLCKFWYKQILSAEGFIIKNINNYIKSKRDIYWEKVPITYGLIEDDMQNDRESYPLSIMQVLANINYLLEHEEYDYNLKYNEISSVEKEAFDYIHYMVIENVYINVLPIQLYELQQLPHDFEAFTDDCRNGLLLIIIIFVVVITILTIIYTILVYKTNKSMDEGFEKVSKIKQDKIEELIKKLELFNYSLQRYLDKDNSSISTSHLKQTTQILNNSTEHNITDDEAKESFLNHNINTGTLGYTPLGKFTTKHPKLIETCKNINSFTNIINNNSANVNNLLINSSYGNNKPILNAKMKRRFGKISSNDNVNNSLTTTGNIDSYLGTETFNTEENDLQNKDNSAQKYSVVSCTLFQSFLIACFFVLFLSLICLITEAMINKAGRILNIECFFLGKALITATETIKIKCEMSLCQISSSDIDFTALVPQNLNRKMANWVSSLEYLNEFYEKFYIHNACLATFDLTKEESYKEDGTFNLELIYKSETYLTCMEDILVKSANNTEGLIQLIDNKIKIIRNEIEINKKVNQEFSPYEMYGNDNFYIFESVFYKYLIGISDNFSFVIMKGYEKYLDKMFQSLIILMTMFGICIIFASIFIGIFYVRTLEHLLSVSRCILKIIPTVIISSTPELESWIETVIDL